MNTTQKLSAYAAAAALLAGGSYAAARSIDAPATSGHTGHGVSRPVAQSPAQTSEPQGLTSSADGYAFAPTASTLRPGHHVFSYRISGPDGRAVTSFEVEHDKRMHLIVVRSDTTGFQHVHPEMGEDGTWSVPVSLAPGRHRVFADFTPSAGRPMTLSADLVVAGDHSTVDHAPSRTASVDGYTVEFAGDLQPGQASRVELRVSRNGRPVTDLQPYLAAYGHLVALRKSDLAYLHVHPEGAPGDGRTKAGPTIEFMAEVPSADTYRLFLDFQHNGVVRTAEFTVPTSSASARVDADEPGRRGAGDGHNH